MSLPKVLGIFSAFLFIFIGGAALIKGGGNRSNKGDTAIAEMSYEVELDPNVQAIEPAMRSPLTALSTAIPTGSEKLPQDNAAKVVSSQDLPEGNRIEELFNKEDPRLPFVETITYKSRVPWQKGRPAWLSDYALHYNTSRHFIARSLNGKADYLKQDVAEGGKFNVFRNDKKIEFYLVVDTSRCKMWFYSMDKDANEKTLLKTYSVALGRLDAGKASSLLTPLGVYSLGNKTAIYRAKAMGYHNGKKVEMRSVFGTRWIPFDKEIAHCSAPAKGLGIHGVPWTTNAQGELEDDDSSIGKYESDGCIRMSTPDMEELYAIIITKPTTIEIVRDFAEAQGINQ